MYGADDDAVERCAGGARARCPTQWSGDAVCRSSIDGASRDDDDDDGVERDVE